MERAFLDLISSLLLVPSVNLTVPRIIIAKLLVSDEASVDFRHHWTTAFLKYCPLKCFWCTDPETQRMLKEFVFSLKGVYNGSGRSRVRNLGAIKRLEG